ncbi:MAG TPA: OFA family MFS transporter [Syntrophomonadaceae bacterium]|nr:OFA family MFS transporter [Syntrophomonadaceae bacterium]
MVGNVSNRWLVVLGALIMQLSLGAIYTWSLFNNPLVEKFGWDPAATVFTFSVTLAFFALSVIIAGRIQDKIGPRIVATAGGILTGLGVATASFATTPMMMYITYGFIAGIGIGSAYVTPLATCVKWFPEKRGLINGLVLAALGLGGVLFKPVILHFIATYGVSTAFLYLGIIYGTLIVIGAQLLATPPEGYTPPGWTPPEPATADSFLAGANDYTTSQAIKTPQFLILVLWMVITATSGLMIISVAADIGMTMVGLSLAAAGNAVVTISLFNAVGRLFWGGVSDKVGRIPSVFTIVVLLGLAMIFMSLISMTYVTFLLATCVVGFCFGGTAALFPTITAEWFGTKNVGNNYGAVFLFYGISALIAPRLSMALGFETAFLVGAVACAVAAALALFVKPPSGKAITN